MPRLLTDVNFNHAIMRGLLRRMPDLDILVAQDAGHNRMADPALLEWAANDGRVLLTHDVNTMSGFAYARTAQGLPVAGVILVHNSTPIGRAIENILLLLSDLSDEDWNGAVRFVPL